MNPVKTLKHLSIKLKALDRKISILTDTAKQSFTTPSFNKPDSSGISPVFQDMIDKVDADVDVQKLYKEWKQDLLIEYFNPRNHK